MNGIDLARVDASYTIDIIHYLFETDIYETQAEQVQAKSDVRSMIYRDLYGTKYNYAVNTEKATYSTNMASDGTYGSINVDDIQQFDPMSGPKVTKPFIPPTDFDENSTNPFGGLLDEPLN